MGAPQARRKQRIGKYGGIAGKSVRIYLSADAVEALEQLADPGERSALVSRLLVEEAVRAVSEGAGSRVVGQADSSAVPARSQTGAGLRDACRG